MRTLSSILLPFRAAIISVAPYGFLRLPTLLSPRLLGRIISVSVSLLVRCLCILIHISHPRGFETRSGIYPPFFLRSSPGSLVTDHLNFNQETCFATLSRCTTCAVHTSRQYKGAYLSPCLVTGPLYIPYRNLY
ncbi:hypothetical protein F5Y00DRAFT_184121 [Daldinia vernicosa]|uniref:uncharacterized protein n=1 Tax=Daldinia vernicosa TaxID=114800 RepID=UPI002008E99B|nr:uncharacterized protein F5Y00DRAFT_184121 [Daldinia vernicosa]KAI0845048.1 hypothetical protein F5Y00DRAFT_184121 [Daldinia vernicosa]